MRDITLHATDHRNLACTLADEVRDAVQYGKDCKVARIQNVLHSLSRQLRSLVFKQLRQVTFGELSAWPLSLQHVRTLT